MWVCEPDRRVYGPGRTRDEAATAHDQFLRSGWSRAGGSAYHYSSCRELIPDEIAQDEADREASSVKRIKEEDDRLARMQEALNKLRADRAAKERLRKQAARLKQQAACALRPATTPLKEAFLRAGSIDRTFSGLRSNP